MSIIDAHLDLAYNALSGRNVTLFAKEQTALPYGIASVGLPDLRAGQVDLICATIFCEPALDGRPGYCNAEEAHLEGMRQLQWYQQIQSEGEIRFITNRRDLATIVDLNSIESHSRAIKTLLLLEGADPLRSPADVQSWYDAGLRIVGLAWKRTRYAGGTGAPGPLTPEGIELVREMDRLGIIHDVSHLAEESFWQLLKLTQGPVMASHSNCQAIVPTDRQLSDDMIRAIADRGGVIGINFFDKFLLSPEEYGRRRATLADVARHVQHIADLTGSFNHIGIGTDMDGGLGRDQIPQEIVTSADLPRIAPALKLAGLDDKAIAGITQENWLRYFGRSLPT